MFRKFTTHHPYHPYDPYLHGVLMQAQVRMVRIVRIMCIKVSGTVSSLKADVQFDYDLNKR
jgi:hypothetical protein